ncbi:VOC family protein [Streptomyces sp. NPDC056144]|uniref:VOC family protein n=1 Tax=unclassified Streptomyces TaxID=2593676 RepID=UPI0035DD211D
MAVQPIPKEYPRITPYLCVDGAADAIDFYVSVFGAVERMRMPAPDGTIGHAELALGNSVVMLADEYPGMDFRSPKAVGGTPVTLHVYVADVDAVFAKALARGSRELQPVKDQFYGDRTGQLEDPFGHRWNIATHVEDVSDEEMERRATEAMKAMGGGGGGGGGVAA